MAAKCRKTRKHHNKNTPYTLFDFKLNTVKKILKIVLLLLATVFVTESQAQQHRKVLYLQNYDNAPYHFGFLLGATFMDYDITLKKNYQDLVFTEVQDLTVLSNDQYTNIDIGPEGFVSYQITMVERDTTGKLINNIPLPGWSLGEVNDLRLNEHLNLRFIPTFSQSEINISYTLQINRETDTVFMTKRSHNHNKINVIELPLHLKYRSKRYNNIAAYIITGINPKYYFTPKENRSTHIEYNKLDLAFELGTGFDFYNQWFKMGLEFKFAYGLTNALSKKQDYYFAKPINQLRNKQFQISLTFE